MFKKPNSGKPDPLAERLRKIADVQAEDVTYSSVAPGEKRSERKPTFKAATLAFITGERVAVVVKNVSDTGARVEFMRDVELPDRVLLSEPTLQLKTWAYVIWQTRGAAGLQFVKT
jgi:DNA-directed RNA polymerase subunit E'/Rpb7